MTNKAFDYRSAGVNIDAGNELIKRIKPYVAKTHRSGVLGGLGGFGGMFELPWQNYRKPVLVSGSDGVGTKLKLAQQLQRYDSVGIDLVAMCVNDIVVSGAEPLFFLDYYASGQLDVDAAEQVIKSIAQGCELAGAALIGGETAEMPGLYHGADFDLAGFALGIVEKDQIIDGHKVRVGDALIGLGSSGLHANGFSLIRKLLHDHAVDLNLCIEQQVLADIVLRPTRIYVKSLLALYKQIDIHALAHITGGGLSENLPRVLPANHCAAININSWQRAPIFDWLQDKGDITDSDMWRTFNCGVGMVVCVGQDDIDKTLSLLNENGENAWLLGTIKASTGPASIEFLT